jgi:hypothetical protein
MTFIPTILKRTEFPAPTATPTVAGGIVVNMQETAVSFKYTATYKLRPTVQLRDESAEKPRPMTVTWPPEEDISLGTTENAMPKSRQ